MSEQTILVVDDDTAILYAFQVAFEEEGYRVIPARNGLESLQRVEDQAPDLVFMDIALPGLDGLQTIERLRALGSDVPIIVMTGFGTMQTAIRAVQLGAYEYLTKPLDVEQVRLVAKGALETRRLRDTIQRLHAELAEQDTGTVLLGNAPAMQEVYKLIGAVTLTPNTTPILIQGESGTGKELVARAIHQNSRSTSGPFIPINCTALPAELLESELFGYEKGAFTGAMTRKPGKFEVAQGGTIFLDEIGNLSTTLQEKFLRVVQEREFERLGGNRALLVKARFVFATNRRLVEEVKAGRFREDLYFRINVLSIILPPLRERKEDIPVLIDHFLQKYDQQLGRRVKTVSSAVMERLLAYEYPGNVRELENLIERCVILAKDEVVLPESLPESLRSVDALEKMGTDVPLFHSNLKQARQVLLRAFEEKFLRHTLDVTGGNVTAAARRAGIRRQSFQRLMKAYGITADPFYRANRDGASTLPPDRGHSAS